MICLPLVIRYLCDQIGKHDFYRSLWPVCGKGNSLGDCGGETEWNIPLGRFRYEVESEMKWILKQEDGRTRTF